MDKSDGVKNDYAKCLIKPFEFNAEQEYVLSRLELYCKDYCEMTAVFGSDSTISYVRTAPGVKKHLIITGSAGTGKTSLIIYSIISSWLNTKPAMMDVNYILCAPTNKAKDVMTNKYMDYVMIIRQQHPELLTQYPTLARKLFKNVQFKTISQVLGINIQINDEGHQEFTKGSTARIITKYNLADYENTIIIIDEASMIDTNCADKLNIIPRPLIFLGDRCQLPPVNEETSVVFSWTADSGKYELLNLTKVERATGNIVQASNYLRDKMLTNLQELNLINYLSSIKADLTNIILYESKPKRWLAEYISRIRQAGINDMGLTWTNKRCSILNAKIRDMLATLNNHPAPAPALAPAPAQLPLIMPGEKLIIKDAYYLYGHKFYSSMLINIKTIIPTKYKPPNLVDWLNCAYYTHLVGLVSGELEFKPIKFCSAASEINSSAAGVAKAASVVVAASKKGSSAGKTLKDYWQKKVVVPLEEPATPVAGGAGSTPVIDENKLIVNWRCSWLAQNNYYKTCQQVKDGFIGLEKLIHQEAGTLLTKYMDNLPAQSQQIKFMTKGLTLDDYRKYHMSSTRYLYGIPVEKLTCSLCVFLSSKLIELINAGCPDTYKMIKLTQNMELECMECITACEKRLNILSHAGYETFMGLESEVHKILANTVQKKIKLTKAEHTRFQQLLDEEGASLINNISGEIYSINLSYILGHYWNHCVKDIFAKWDYGYFITVHKSQGSDYDNVFLDYHDLINNSKVNERARLIYTGLTRSKLNCHIYYNPD